ncbi:MAG: hypothetical protein ACOCXT_06060 [Candidatus Dojkabacteria bacterium]
MDSLHNASAYFGSDHTLPQPLLLTKHPTIGRSIADIAGYELPKDEGVDGKASGEKTVDFARVPIGLEEFVLRRDPFSARGRKPNEHYKDYTKRLLEPDSILSGLGFIGFEGKFVADIGSRDGRYYTIPQEHGAKRVIAVEPDEHELKKAIEAGIIANENAFISPLQGLTDEFRNKIDVALVLTIDPQLLRDASFFESLHATLVAGGQAVITLAESELLDVLLIAIKKKFTNIRLTRNIANDDTYLHNNFFVVTK